MRLFGSTGYDQTKPIVGNFEANPDQGTVDMCFEQVPTTADYSLTYIGGDGQETMLVQGRPFHTLKDNLLPEEPDDAPAPTPGP